MGSEVKSLGTHVLVMFWIPVCAHRYSGFGCHPNEVGRSHRQHSQASRTQAPSLR